MAKTANKPRMTCARPAKSDPKSCASKQYHQPSKATEAGLPTIEDMQAYNTSSDGAESDQSGKATSLGMSESEQEEYSTPEADKAVDMEDVQHTDDNITKHTPDKTQSPIRKVDNAPTDKLPSLLETATASESPLERVARIYQSNPRATDNPEARIYQTPTRWYSDRREVLAAEDPQAHAFKLGMPIKRGDRLKLVHVRSVTGSSLDPSDTGPTGFPYTGTPQLKIVDLDETVKEVLKHLRYLNALLYDISHSPETIVFDLEHTHIWLNRTEKCCCWRLFPAAAKLIVQHPYSRGFPTTTGWLPSKEVSDAVATREVAIVDKKQILLDHHRSHFVQAVAEHMGKLTLNTTILKEAGEVFDLHVPSRQWAPSVPGDPASLLQWKRNGGGYAINYYAIFTEEAYGALAKAGKQTVRVPAGVDDRGRHIIAPVTLEVGRWSAKGAKPVFLQTK
ncbi:hypothetical protein CYMTET_36783 [Cymbomonas tetramitiformis]|uniref:Uncharacterized protein n=1 Tax=Cymbomonas tetramitiformis TaxID=36881 RepID=A0AAE0F6W5_9CHLO|nr:hypothetical protein CYMTET_36783 [Cymbomonas tetramitiformis]